MNLCICDLMNCIVTYLVMGINTIVDDKLFKNKSISCYIQASLFHFTATLLFYTMMLIGFSRYIRICHTATYNIYFKSTRQSLKMIAGTWMIATGVALTTIIFEDHITPIVLNSDHCCHGDFKGIHAGGFVYLVIGTAVPISISMVSYWNIFLV